MAIEEDGPWSIVVMWFCSALVLVFVMLRIYTRLFLLHWYGSDDVTYMIAYVFLVAFCIIMTISAQHGFGQEHVANPDDEAIARFYEGLGINIVGTGMIIAKLSLGLFLLRIVHLRWQKVAIWGVMLLLMSASLACVVVFWAQCKPVAYIWDRQIEGGRCPLNFVPAAYCVTATCVFVDFFFVFFPWMVLWNLQINRREKTVILGSLSLGVIAGACGVKRTIEIGKLSRPDFLKATVPAAVWSAAEMSVTMVCIGFPVCLPFFRRVHERWTTKDPNSTSGTTGIQFPSARRTAERGFDDDATRLSEMARKLGIAGTLVETRVESRRSDEEIALAAYRSDSGQTGDWPRTDRIHVTAEYMVTNEAPGAESLEITETPRNGAIVQY